MNRHQYFRLLLVFTAFALFLTACSGSSPETPIVQEAVVAPDQTNTSIPESVPSATNPPEATSTLTNTPIPPTPTSPPPTPTPPPVGLSRANPYAPSDLVNAPNWDIQILDVVKGEEAWQKIRSANMFNSPPNEGNEYILVYLYAKSTHPDDDETHSISGNDFRITGDRKILYSIPMVVEPSPQLDAKLYPGGETEGWVAFEVGEGETNLILIVDELFNFDLDRLRFIALEEGASIAVPFDLAEIEPTDVGGSRSNPAPFGEMITTEDWQITITDVVRGADAWEMISKANMFNDPPEEGMEYIAVKAYARLISTEDESADLSWISFKSTGAANVVYDRPSVVSPEPKLDVRLYPGGEFEGWFVVQSAIGEADMKVIFEPLFDFSGKNKRFLSIEP
jgi:hypothetical protein